MKRLEAEVGSVDTYHNPIEYGHAPIITGPQPRWIRADAEPPNVLSRSRGGRRSVARATRRRRQYVRFKRHSRTLGQANERHLLALQDPERVAVGVDDPRCVGEADVALRANGLEGSQDSG
jgi:hypothetical protein